MKLDQPSIERLALIYPDIRVRIIRVYNDICNHYGLQMKCTQGLRSFAEQDALFAQGRTAPGEIVTDARGGESMHNYGCGLDSAFMGPDPYLKDNKNQKFFWNEYGRFCKLHGLFWGGDFFHNPDRPHAQLTYGQSLGDLKALYQHGGIPAVWAKFDLIRQIPIGLEWEKDRAKLLGGDKK